MSIFVNCITHVDETIETNLREKYYFFTNVVTIIPTHFRTKLLTTKTHFRVRPEY